MDAAHYNLKFQQKSKCLMQIVSLQVKNSFSFPRVLCFRRAVLAGHLKAIWRLAIRGFRLNSHEEVSGGKETSFWRLDKAIVGWKVVP